MLMFMLVFMLMLMSQFKPGYSSSLFLKYAERGIFTFSFCFSVTFCKQRRRNELRIDHSTVAGFLTWPLNGSEAGSDLVLIQTPLLLLCKSTCSYAN